MCAFSASKAYAVSNGDIQVAYIDPEGDPLWFTIGKGSEDLIPTIYTLWKKQDLLPFLSTPSAVTPILIGGADLMIPGGSSNCLQYFGQISPLAD